MVRCLTFLAITFVFYITSTEGNGTAGLNLIPIMDPKHRTELVDEAFLEQKDVLLEMLEAKLKEVRDKKKKKKPTEKSGPNSSESNKCETSSMDKMLSMKANGISNVGVMNLLMNHGATGKGKLKLDADGISNVGRAHLNLGMEGGLNLPGISDSLVAAPPRLNTIFCSNKEPTNENNDLDKSKVIPAHSNEAINIEDKTLRKSFANTSSNHLNTTKTGVNTTEVDVKTANSSITSNSASISVDANVIDISKNTATSSTLTGNITILEGSAVPSVTVSEGAVTEQTNLNLVT